MILTGIVWGLFGLVIGSFLNVFILRHGTGRGITGRSACLSCGRTLQWFDLIPLVSYIYVRGTCRTCKSHLSIQYPLVEAVTGLSFALIGAAPISILVQALCAAMIALLIAIAVYDILHTIIPDSWVYAFILLAFVFGIVAHGGAVGNIPDVIIGGITALPLLLLWYFSKGTWMGFGDVKLAFGIGLALGASAGIVALLFAFLIGAAIGVFILLPLQHINTLVHAFGITSLRQGTKGFTMKSEVPFGPFLILGFSIVWFAQLYNISFQFLWII